MAKNIGIGLAGLGTVGAGVYTHLEKNRALIAERTGFDLSVGRIACRNPERADELGIPKEKVSGDWRHLVDDPDLPVVCELMGGIPTAKEMILAAIAKGKIVVTANKALLAEHGQEIFAAAAKARVPVFFEAAAAGGVPIIKALREAFVANHIRSMAGIINGTGNYILTRMTESGSGFQEALAEAQAHGYAEADPTLDVNGWDAAHKAIILASLAYGFWVESSKLFVQGIESLTATDIRFADRLGCRIKSLGLIKADPSGQIEVRVHPTLIPKDHVLASVNGVFNAVAVNGDVVGETLFYGRGAGQDATASAVISDLAEAALALESPRRNYGFMPHGLYGKCKPVEEIVSGFYLRLSVIDQPGVLAQVAGILGEHGAGISQVLQPEGTEGELVPLIFVLHPTRFGVMRAALDAIGALPVVGGAPVLIPVESFDEAG
jgi:homoserine dehydrogenase